MKYLSGFPFGQLLTWKSKNPIKKGRLKLTINFVMSSDHPYFACFARTLGFVNPCTHNHHVEQGSQELSRVEGGN